MERNEFLSALVCICVSLSLCLLLQGIILILILIMIMILARVTLRARIANQLGEDSYCRGGIVNTRFVCSRALFVRRESSKALWRFRANTSNSRSGLSWPHPRTHMCYIYQIYAQQDIRVCEDDHVQPRKWQFPNPKALWLLRKYLSTSR